MADAFKIPQRYQPKGFTIIYEDRDVLVGNKAPGFLTVSAKWNKEHTIHAALNQYVRKGNSRSHERVYVVHRLDQDTSGVLIFAKTPSAQIFLKAHWKDTIKIYYAVVQGRLAQKTGIISSYLAEDDEYVVHSTGDAAKGKLAQTGYTVVKEAGKFSLVRIDLLTGKKNQIRVHFAERGHPVVGDSKYGPRGTRFRFLALHAQSISFIHPFSKERLTFEVEVPKYFQELVGPREGWN